MSTLTAKEFLVGRGVPGFLAALAMLTACTSAGPKSGDTGITPPPPLTAALGTRGVPGYQLAVDHDGAIIAGGTATVILSVVPAAGQGAPVAVAAALSNELPETWLTGQSSTDGLQWSWTVAVPADLDQQRVWIRVRDAAGNVSQSGSDDFALLP